jgi:hypothetical protein
LILHRAEAISESIVRQTIVRERNETEFDDNVALNKLGGISIENELFY